MFIEYIDLIWGIKFWYYMYFFYFGIFDDISNVFWSIYKVGMIGIL